MMATISDLINHLMELVRKTIERLRNTSLPYYTVPAAYSGTGLLLVIIVPSLIFTRMERKSEFYFILVAAGDVSRD